MKACIYAPNRALGPDYKGGYPCQRCGLPESNARHHQPIPDSPADRAAGKDNDDE